MNRMLGRLMSLIAVPVLAACASSGPQLVQAPTPQQQPAAAALHYDSMYMAQGSARANTWRSAQRIELDLDFLPAADYRVSLWRDGEGSEGLRREQQRIDADHRTLVLDLPAGGGAVAHLVPPAPRIAAIR